MRKEYKEFKRLAETKEIPVSDNPITIVKEVWVFVKLACKLVRPLFLLHPKSLKRIDLILSIEL